MAAITPSHQMPFSGIVMKMLIPPPAGSRCLHTNFKLHLLASLKMVRSLLGWWSLTTGFISFLRSQIMLEETD